MHEPDHQLFSLFLYFCRIGCFVNRTLDLGRPFLFASAFDLGLIPSSYDHMISHTTPRSLEGAHEEHVTHDV